MHSKEFRENEFITKNKCVDSFNLRVSAIVHTGGKYLMVLNEGAKKYKHPGGHLNLKESLTEGLKRELMEEIGLHIETSQLDVNTIFFDSVLKNRNLMINSLFQIEINLDTAEKIIEKSPLPARLIPLSELNTKNTWESEIRAIEHFMSKG